MVCLQLLAHKLVVMATAVPGLLNRLEIGLQVLLQYLRPIFEAIG